MFLVPLTSPANPVLARALGETVALWVRGIGWSDYSRVVDIPAGQALGPGGDARAPHGATVYRSFQIVPDGVAKVIMYIAAGVPRQGVRPTFIGKIEAIVHDNVGVFQNRRPPGLGVYEQWYAADGRLITRVGPWNPPKRDGLPPAGTRTNTVPAASTTRHTTP